MYNRNIERRKNLEKKNFNDTYSSHYIHFMHFILFYVTSIKFNKPIILCIPTVGILNLLINYVTIFVRFKIYHYGFF